MGNHRSISDLGIHADLIHADLPMPSAARAKEVFADSRDEILTGHKITLRHVARLDAATKALVAAFEDGRFAEIKQAAEAVRESAQAIATTSKQIEYLAAGLVTGCCHQLNRRPRA